jgi:hypothetical protein
MNVKMGRVRRCHPERSKGSHTHTVLLRSMILFCAIKAIKVLALDQALDPVLDSVRDWMLDSALVSEKALDSV